MRLCKTHYKPSAVVVELQRWVCLSDTDDYGFIMPFFGEEFHSKRAAIGLRLFFCDSNGKKGLRVCTVPIRQRIRSGTLTSPVLRHSHFIGL